MAHENDMEWSTPGKCCKKCDTKSFSGFELLHFYESVFPLIRESISEAIKRKLSNRDYKMEKNEGSRWKSHNQKWTIRETGNIDEEKLNKNTTQ